jgi:hypothetical protein
MANYIRPRMKAITPLEMYKTLVGGATDAVRYADSGLTYVPSQFGGVFGQAQVLNQGLVLKVVDFKVDTLT